MGYKIEKRKATLEFTGSNFEGAEVEVLLDVSLGEFTEFLNIDDKATVMTLGDTEYVWFEENILKSWNLEDEDGIPIPIEKGCMTKIPRLLSRAIMRAWFKEVTELPENLEEDSTTGDSAPVDPTLMTLPVEEL